MTDLTAPALRPANPRFSSGPCAKIPGYTLDLLGDAPLGRSHRAVTARSKLYLVAFEMRGHFDTINNNRLAIYTN